MVTRRGMDKISYFLTKNKGIFITINRYFGKGVLKAVANVNNIIGPALKGKNPAE
jgi:enolase